MAEKNLPTEIPNGEEVFKRERVFIGIVEHIHPNDQSAGSKGQDKNIAFCMLEDDGGMTATGSVESLAEIAAIYCGRDAPTMIVFEAPPGIDYRGCEHGDAARTYYRLNDDKKALFDKILAKEMKRLENTLELNMVHYKEGFQVDGHWVFWEMWYSEKPLARVYGISESEAILSLISKAKELEDKKYYIRIRNVK